MKKISILLAFIFISTLMVNAEPVQKRVVNYNITPEQQKVQEERLKRAQAFEKKLGLSDTQIVKAREIRFQGQLELSPILQEIRLKKQEEKMIKMSRIAVEEQERRLAVIDLELKKLEKQAKELRKKNMKEFESILTNDQKKILKQMKKEGRKRYHQEHPKKNKFAVPTNK